MPAGILHAIKLEASGEKFAWSFYPGWGIRTYGNCEERSMPWKGRAVDAAVQVGVLFRPPACRHKALHLFIS